MTNFAYGALLLGNIVYMHVLGQPMIILSSQEVIRDLMEKRSAIYSDRPRFVLLNELFVHVRHSSLASPNTTYYL
jgi:hypothetical protein